MKKILTTLLLFAALNSYSQTTAKDTAATFKIEGAITEWSIYFRNLDRLNTMAGRIVASDIMMSTKDTVEYFNRYFIQQLQKQIDKRDKKNAKP